MKQVRLIHNPGAGNEEHTAEDLKALIVKGGYECGYTSTKDEKWEALSPHVDLIAVAGGDGTVKKVAEWLLKQDKQVPLALIPLGTANNIAKTLGITGSPKENIRSWKSGVIRQYDVGMITGVDDASLMIESFGYGIFPYLMLEIKKAGTVSDTPEEELKLATELLHKILGSYKSRFCEIKVDGTDHSGKFLLAEVMNIRSIGPNLFLSPYADPGDGEFEVVLVPEKHKDKLVSYLLGKMQGDEQACGFHTLKGRKIRISWEGTHVHVDDQIIKLEKAETVKVKLNPGALQFLVPNKSTGN